MYWPSKMLSHYVINKSYIITSLLTFVIFFSVLFIDINHQKSIENIQHSETVFLLDVSNSMNAKDVEGNSRISTAKRIIWQILQQDTNTEVFYNVKINGIIKDGGSIALVIFTGQAQCIVPLCNDLTYFFQTLHGVNGGFLDNQSTNLQIAIETAISVYSNNNLSTQKNLVLLSDGENHYGDLSHINELLQKTNINLHVIGIGTTTGAICTTNTYNTNAPPQQVKTKLDSATLNSLAGILCSTESTEGVKDNSTKQSSNSISTVLLLLGALLILWQKGVE